MKCCCSVLPGAVAEVEVGRGSGMIEGEGEGVGELSLLSSYWPWHCRDKPLTAAGGGLQVDSSRAHGAHQLSEESAESAPRTAIKCIFN